MRLNFAVAPLSLLVWALVAILPFLSRIHYVPLPQWFGEASVVWLTLLAAGLLGLAGLCQRGFGRGRKEIAAEAAPTAIHAAAPTRPSAHLFAALPRAGVWMLVLAAAWALQGLFVPLLFPGLNQATALAFTALALLAGVTLCLRDWFGDEEIHLRLAQALLAGALLQSLIGLAQVTGLVQVLGGLLFYDSAHVTTNVFGHIGQRNQYAHYLSWGVVAVAYLWAVRSLSRAWALALLAWLALSIAWAGSRTVLLYAAAMLVLSPFWLWRVRDGMARRFAMTLALAALAIIVLQFALPAFNSLLSALTGQGGVASGVERIAAAGGESMNSRRFAEWHKAWLVFNEAPWLGAGWSQFASHSVALQTRPEFAAAAFNSGLFTNAHNLLLQLLAETGVVGTTLVLGGLLWVGTPFFGRQMTAHHLLPVTVLAISLIHSMVEYPLWYLYFPAVGVMALSLAPSRPFVLPRLLQAGAWGLSLWLVVLCATSLPRYWELVGLYTPAANSERRSAQEVRLGEIIEREPLFAFHALNTLDNYLQPTARDLPQKLAWITRLAAFRPYPDVLLKKAQMEVLAGQPDQARRTLQQALASFPTYAPQFMATLAGSEPAWQGLYQEASAARGRLPERYR
ncbi:polymerase [Aquitalea sp. S1-19]|nr:polymerase [Aquitalea sp. S1-19]